MATLGDIARELTKKHIPKSDDVGSVIFIARIIILTQMCIRPKRIELAYNTKHPDTLYESIGRTHNSHPVRSLGHAEDMR
jgi:hypothetical protein